MKKIYVTTGFLAALLLSSFATFAQTQSREDILKEIEAKHKELDVLEKNYLAVSKEDLAKYADFLRAPETGLIRLLPRERFDKPRLSDASRQQTPGLTMQGGGSYYSFSELKHEYTNGSDIELQNGDLTTGFHGADYGLLVTLGDVPLENVGLELPEVNVLAGYKPAANEPHARVEQRRLGQGTEIDGLKVKSRVPMRADSTYLLRSVDYHFSDALVAFRVVRVDTDGSAIILWKRLKKFSIPELDRNAN